MILITEDENEWFLLFNLDQKQIALKLVLSALRIGEQRGTTYFPLIISGLKVQLSFISLFPIHLYRKEIRPNDSFYREII